jgi:hypothetical protein
LDIVASSSLATLVVACAVVGLVLELTFSFVGCCFIFFALETLSSDFGLASSAATPSMLVAAD